MDNNSDCEIVTESEGCEIISVFNRLRQVIASIKTEYELELFKKQLNDFFNDYLQINISEDMFENLIYRMMEQYNGTSMFNKARFSTALDSVELTMNQLNIHVNDDDY